MVRSYCKEGTTKLMIMIIMIINAVLRRTIFQQWKFPTYVLASKIKVIFWPFKPKVHYASWSETCSKPAGDLLAS